MERNCRVFLGTEWLFQKITAFIYKYRYTISGSLIAGFLAYTFIFTNKIPNHDDVAHLFGKGATIESGRWGLTVLSWLFPDFSMPWIYGVISLLILTVSVCFLVHMFSIRSSLLQFLVGAIIVTVPSQIGTFAYMFTAASYAFALLLSVVSAYILCQCKPKLFSVAVICLVLSVSVYQAYLSVTASIFIIYSIFVLITDRKKPESVFCAGIGYVAFLVFSLGLYWITTQVVWKVTGTTLGEYADGALTFRVDSILDRIVMAYEEFLNILFDRKHRVISTEVSRYMHIACFVFLGTELLLWLNRNREIKKLALLVFLIAVLPLGINLMYVFVSMDSIHTLVLYSFFVLYVLVIIVLEHGQCQLLKNTIMNHCRALFMDIAVLGMTIIMVSNIYTANQAYLKMHIAYENMYSFANSVVTQLQGLPGYTLDSKVAITGKFVKKDYIETEFEDIKGLIGVGGINPNNYSYPDFFKYYIGMDINWATPEECAAIEASEAYKALPAYPEAGYITTMDDMFIINMSRNECVN